MLELFWCSAFEFYGWGFKAKPAEVTFGSLLLIAHRGAQKPRSSYARKYRECADTSWKCRCALRGYLSHVIGLKQRNPCFKDKSPEFFHRWKNRSGSGWLTYQNPRPAACVSVHHCKWQKWCSSGLTEFCSPCLSCIARTRRSMESSVCSWAM